MNNYNDGKKSISIGLSATLLSGQYVPCFCKREILWPKTIWKWKEIWFPLCYCVYVEWKASFKVHHYMRFFYSFLSLRGNWILWFLLFVLQVCSDVIRMDKLDMYVQKKHLQSSLNDRQNADWDKQTVLSLSRLGLFYKWKLDYIQFIYPIAQRQISYPNNVQTYTAAI